jgi:hypothetical protein
MTKKEGGGGVSQTWCSWIERVLYNGIVAVKINGDLGPYFQSYKGVRQGDPPFSFIVQFCNRQLNMNGDQGTTE